MNWLQLLLIILILSDWATFLITDHRLDKLEDRVEMLTKVWKGENSNGRN